MKFLVTKSISNDEQLQFEVEGDSVADLAIPLHHGLAILDDRCREVGTRVVDAMKQTEGLPPAVRQAINATMGILYGRPGAMQEMQVAREHLDASEKTNGVAS